MTPFTIDFTRPFGEIVDELSKLKNQPVEGPDTPPSYSTTPPSCRKNGSIAPLTNYDFAQQCTIDNDTYGIHLSTHRARSGEIINMFFAIDEAVRIYLGFAEGFKSLVNSSDTPDGVKHQIDHGMRCSIHGNNPLLVCREGQTRPCVTCSKPTHIEVLIGTRWVRWCGC